MEWIESTIATKSEGIEPLTGLLAECGVLNIQIQDDAEFKQFLKDNPLQWDYIDEDFLNSEPRPASVTFYLTNNPSGRETLAIVRQRLEWLKSLSEGDYGSLDLSVESKDDEKWLNEWKKYYKPFNVGRIVVRPEWEPYEKKPEELVLTINPGHVFGTGLHQTTKLCLLQLESSVFKGATIMDFGCGSGILAIAALLLGAEMAYACDLDPNAADIARENARLNGIPDGKLAVLSGNAITDEALREKMLEWPKADVITANIVADAIAGLADLAWQCLKPGGVFISSGIIGPRLDDVKDSLIRQGFELSGEHSMDDWRSLVMRRA